MATITGTWNNPADRRSNRKLSYRSMAIAEKNANRASQKEERLIIAYQCFDCGSFHIGRADNSQKLARHRETRTVLPPKCIFCRTVLHVRRDIFNPHPDGPVCLTERCNERRAARRSLPD